MENLNSPALPDTQRISPILTPHTVDPLTSIGRWLFMPEMNAKFCEHAVIQPWYKVLWLTGVDYFSTLGYQPGIALLAAGNLSPIATIILVTVTLFCALPTYREVARRSYAGQGSIAMLETLLTGWSSKLLVLVLLGFASTDFIITITLSAADAAVHITENPLFNQYLGHSQVGITIILIGMLAAVFLKGFSEAIGVATFVAVPYIVLNAIILSVSFHQIYLQPELWHMWSSAIHLRGDWTALIIFSALVFPNLALGMSGFETGVSVMPLVKGSAQDQASASPSGRIKSTQKLLAAAALIMSVLLLCSSLATTLLIPESAYAHGGAADGRAISYLSHKLLGHHFGTIYDLSTVLVLWFAGASAMAGMLNLIPRYLPRFGMAPRWIAFRRPLVLALFAIAILVTLIFKADVNAQGSAYATGVLALMLSAAVAVALALKKEAASRAKIAYFWVVAAVFAYTFLDNVFVKPDGLVIAATFVMAIITLGAFSRWHRSLDLRVMETIFEDAHSAQIWRQISYKKVNLVPLAHCDTKQRVRKAKELRAHYNFNGRIAFLHVELVNNRSEFFSTLRIKAIEDKNGDVFIYIKGATAIANTIAYVSELLNPISIFIGLTRTNLVSQSIRYLLWGEGETGLLVYRILLRYWEWTPEDDVRPLIFLMSE